MFAVSTDEEVYFGRYETIEEAIANAPRDHWRFWIGECDSPIPPENYWDADDWLEHVSCQDDYSGEWADDWDHSTKAEREELELEVRAVMAKWLDRHGLRPDFHNIVNAVEYQWLDNDTAVKVDN